MARHQFKVFFEKGIEVMAVDEEAAIELAREKLIELVESKDFACHVDVGVAMPKEVQEAMIKHMLENGGRVEYRDDLD